MAVNETINHGVALIVGFIMAIIIEEVVAGQFTDSVLSVVADNITALYIVLVLALFASRMSGSLGNRGPAGGM